MKKTVTIVALALLAACGRSLEGSAADLVSSKDRWMTSGLDPAYEIEYVKRCTCLGYGRHVMTVVGGKVTRLRKIDGDTTEAIQQRGIPTVRQMFDLTLDSLRPENDQLVVKVTFDKQQGFPRLFRYDLRSMFDEEYEVEVLSVRPVIAQQALQADGSS